MVKRNSPEKQLERLIQSELLVGLEDVIIFQNPDGSYELFNAYTISKNKQKLSQIKRWYYSLKDILKTC